MADSIGFVKGQWCSERKGTFPLSGKLSFVKERKGKALHFFWPGNERERKGDFQKELNTSFSKGVLGLLQP